MKITLATLPQATAQDVFNQVATHLLTQNKQSRKFETSEPKFAGTQNFCRYRGALGTMCAAGCLIGDDEYHLDMESAGTWTGIVDENFAPSSHSDLIRELQCVHDENNPRFWAKELINVAKNNGLSHDVVTNWGK